MSKAKTHIVGEDGKKTLCGSTSKQTSTSPPEVDCEKCWDKVPPEIAKVFRP